MKAILQWVLRTMMKDQTGVMQTLPKKDLVDFNVAMTAERLMRNGIDPNALKNVNQVENAINQIEAPRNVDTGIRNTESAKVFNIEGKELDPKKPIMGGTQTGKELSNELSDRLASTNTQRIKQKIADKKVETEAEILARMNRENKKSVENIKNKMTEIDEAIDNASPGFAGDRKYDAQLVADSLAEKRFGKEFYDLDQKQQMQLYDEAYTGLSKQRFKNKPDPEDMADGGVAGLLGERTGFKKGSSMTRRTFLKLLGGMAAIPIVGKFLKPMKVGKAITKVPVIQTENVAGKPEWFDALVNKVIMEGDDVTKRFATAERQSIHQKTLDDGSVVRVTEDVDDGAVRVEYESDKNVFEDPVQLQYRKPLPDEGDPRPTAEFTTAESGPVGRQVGPDDFDIDVDEVGGTSIKDLDSDVSKLKEYATGKGPTMKELVQNIKRKDKAKAITEGGDEMIDAVTRRQGDYDPFASGGIARMLGE
jgi:hypothetical protein